MSGAIDEQGATREDDRGAPATRLDGATILQVLPELNAGGVERGAIEIAEAVVSAGGRAIVASAGGRMVERLAAVGGEHVAMPLRSKNPATIWANARRLTAFARAEDVSIVHARSRAPAWSALMAARRAGARFVTTYHGVYNEDLPFKRAYNAVMAKGDRVIAISQFVALVIAERHGVGSERVSVIPRGADLRAFTLDEATLGRAAALRREWSLDGETRPIIMLPGRLTRWKGQSVFIDAMAALAAEGVEAVGLLVGGEKGGATLSGGPFETELRGRIAAAGLDERVRLLGDCGDMPAAYAVADVVVSASTDPEAFGRVAVEAQAMARPVVASAHGGAIETVERGVTGWLTTPGDAADLARALRDAARLSPERRAAMGAVGRARVEERFSVAAMQAATLRVYLGLLAR